MIKAEVIQDSINAHNGKRLTSFIWEFPRWILAEINTHRVLSRNAASSRAIPIKKMIEQVMTRPAMLEFWGRNQAGMQSNEELRDDVFVTCPYDKDGKPFICFSEECSEKERARRFWLYARNSAVESAKLLEEAGLHKQYVNRSIENFMYVRSIVSGTEFENLFALRAHKDAQPEFQKLAFLALDAYNASTPKVLKKGEWHIPFGDSFDEDRIHALINHKNIVSDDPVNDIKRKIAVARCARVSYFNFEGKDDYEADIKLCDDLFGSVPKHLSPAEHVAMCIDYNGFIGNFCGWKQYRKFFCDENLSDSRVKKHFTPK